MSTDACHTEFPFLRSLGIADENFGCFNGTSWSGSGPVVAVTNPTTGKVIAAVPTCYGVRVQLIGIFQVIARVRTASLAEYESCIAGMDAARRSWAMTPAPRRGEIVRLIGAALRDKR